MEQNQCANLCACKLRGNFPPGQSLCYLPHREEISLKAEDSAAQLRENSSQGQARRWIQQTLYILCTEWLEQAKAFRKMVSCQTKSKSNKEKTKQKLRNSDGGKIMKRQLVKQDRTTLPDDHFRAASQNFNHIWNSNIHLNTQNCLNLPGFRGYIQANPTSKGISLRHFPWISNSLHQCNMLKISSLINSTNLNWHLKFFQYCHKNNNIRKHKC